MGLLHVAQAAPSRLAGIQEGAPPEGVSRDGMFQKNQAEAVCPLVTQSQKSQRTSSSVFYGPKQAQSHTDSRGGDRGTIIEGKVQRHPMYTLPLTCTVSPLSAAPTRMVHRDQG